VGEATISGGRVEITSGSIFGLTQFAANGGGTLQVDAAENFLLFSEVSGFGAGDDIDFRAVAFSGSDLSWGQGPFAGELRVENGLTLAIMPLDGNYVGGSTLSVTNGVTSSGLVAGGSAFSATADSAGGTDVTLGSLIATIDVLSGGAVSNTIINNGGIQEIESSGTAIATTVHSGGQEFVSSGATDRRTTVTNGGLLLVEGGNASNAVLSSGGSASILGGGLASGTTVLSGAVQVVSHTVTSAGIFGALATATVLEGGEEIVSGADAEAQSVRVNSGGFELVEGGSLFDARISGGVVEFASGGLLLDEIRFTANGTLQLDQGASFDGAQVSGFGAGDDIDFRGFAFSGTTLSWAQATGGGQLRVSSGSLVTILVLDGNHVGGQTVSVTNGVTSSGLVAAGSAFSVTADSAGGTDVAFGSLIATIDVLSGGVVSNTIINNGGIQEIEPSGTAIGTTVHSGGQEFVSAGVIDSATTVSNGGMLVVEGGGASAVNAVLSSGGSASIRGGGVAIGTTVLSGAVQVVTHTVAIVIFAGLATGTVLEGGEEIVSGAESESVRVNSGGFELVTAGGTTSVPTISGGTVEIGSGGQLSGTASFATSGGGTLQLDQAISYASAGAAVSGFALGDFIDFRAVGFTSGATSATWNQIVSSGANASGTLTVASGSVSADITLLGQYLQGNFKISNDLHGGTLLADPPVTVQTDPQPTTLVNPHTG
jgi:autotransporter passenger strand-loop-strand repeat protein